MGSGAACALTVMESSMRLVLRVLAELKPKTLYVLLPVGGSDGAEAVLLDILARLFDSTGLGSVKPVKLQAGPLGFHELAYKVKLIVRDLLSRCSRVAVVVGGRAPSMLVAAAALAVALLDDDEMVELHVYDEEVSSKTVLRSREAKYVKLSEEERSILRMLVDELLKGGRGSISPSELARRTDMPKSTAHQKLRKLRGHGLLEGGGTNYRITLKGVLNA